MPTDPLYEEAVHTLKQLGSFISLLNPSEQTAPQSSFQLRRISFELYSELLFQTRSQGLHERKEENKLSDQLEFIVWQTHSIYKTQPAGPFYANPR